METNTWKKNIEVSEKEWNMLRILNTLSLKIFIVYRDNFIDEFCEVTWEPLVLFWSGFTL
jgi:hypothetical protein